MAEEQQVTRQTVTTGPAPGYEPAPGYAPPGYRYDAPITGEAVTTTRVRQSPSTAEVLRRIVIFIFALIQLDIVLRIVLLLIGASADNAIVSFIYTTSDWFVGPFNGLLNTNALHHGGSVLDVAAIVALVGWTILELVIIAALNIARREP